MEWFDIQNLGINLGMDFFQGKTIAIQEILILVILPYQDGMWQVWVSKIRETGVKYRGRWSCYNVTYAPPGSKGYFQTSGNNDKSAI